MKSRIIIPESKPREPLSFPVLMISKKDSEVVLFTSDKRGICLYAPPSCGWRLLTPSESYIDYTDTGIWQRFEGKLEITAP